MPIVSSAGLGHSPESWAKLLMQKVTVGENAKEASEQIIAAAMQQSRRMALLDASSEVAGHWNDRDTMCNQYDQAQRSAGVLQRKALNVA